MWSVKSYHRCESMSHTTANTVTGRITVIHSELIAGTSYPVMILSLDNLFPQFICFQINPVLIHFHDKIDINISTKTKSKL
jgi:hypothetical protein